MRFKIHTYTGKGPIKKLIFEVEGRVRQYKTLIVALATIT
jgi:hypothetical protein